MSVAPPGQIQPPLHEAPTQPDGRFSPAWIQYFQAVADRVTAGALLTSGGTMSGALVLAADPVTALQPATKAYADAGDAAGLAATATVATALSALTLRVATLEGADAALQASSSYANDAAAAAGGVAVGHRYRTGSAVMVRIV